MDRFCIEKKQVKDILILTGELSGETHGYNLIKTIKERISVNVYAMGSKKLKEVGAQILYDYRKISLTGLSEIFYRLPHIWDAYRRIKEHISSNKPDLVLLVDFPGFNLMIARLAKRSGIPVIYFIPPQIWAWRTGRIEKIKRYVDYVICILPFEKKLYDENGIEATYVGHPFVNMVRPKIGKEEFLKSIGVDDAQPLITVMPGSRENEIVKHTPILIKTLKVLEKRLDRPKFLLPLAESIERNTIERYNTEGFPFVFIRGLTYEALAHSDLAIIASGSATLEAALLLTPTIVIYRLSRLSYALAKRLVKIRYITLPNLIMDKEVYPEFINFFNPETIAEKAVHMLNIGRKGYEEDLSQVKKSLEGDDPYKKAADVVLGFLGDRTF